MYKKFLGILSMTTYLTSAAYGINYKILDQEADSYCTNIRLNTPITEQQIEKTLSSSIVRRGEVIGPEYTEDNFTALYARVTKINLDDTFKRFASLCKRTYETHKESEKRTILHLLLQRVTDKFEDYQKLLTRSSRRREELLSQKENPEIAEAKIQAFFNMDNPRGPECFQKLREVEEKHLQFARQSIVDDVVAQAIRDPRPRSISNVLGKVASFPNLEEEDVFDLSDNTISRDGAIQILRFIADNSNRFSNLQTLNLKGNRITGDDDRELKEAFKRVLELPQITRINIEGNYIAHIGWIQAMTEYVGGDLVKKISWAPAGWTR